MAPRSRSRRSGRPSPPYQGLKNEMARKSKTSMKDTSGLLRKVEEYRAKLEDTDLSGGEGEEIHEKHYLFLMKAADLGKFAANAVTAHICEDKVNYVDPHGAIHPWKPKAEEVRDLSLRVIAVAGTTTLTAPSLPELIPA